ASAPKGAKVLGEVHSAPIEDLVANMLEVSDNVLAEAVGREVARATGNEPSFDGATTAVLNTLRRNGLDTTGATMADCSGLSTQDRLPARLLASILAASTRTGTDDVRTAKLRPMLTGLPVAGGTGTLDESHDRFQGSANSSGRGYVQAKTGTLTGVSTLAGVVLDSDDRVLVFAMMSNGSVPAEARPALDAIATRLRECGCS
ncbi:MAG: D-alanyl-D-alanine carboxypeptidase/D-alanyl-D-alanine endopeptidase, partial [Sciscionella sp.]